ncbi:hypothetical protein TWF481_006432 [Arthrobotrys musiformis]|uniref:Phosphoglycerate mutase-like protein n=1 Tax=Arthrobotrys musiformis TaxID=47236 RepID=A0AAV9WIA4_9PEZI
MPPRLLHLVRHAQGHHNVNWQHYLRDPALTDLGHSQCQRLASTFPHHSSITHVVCSPLKRTIQTTLESFHPTIARLVSQDKDFKIRANPYFQENGEWECDIGSTIPEIQEFLSNFVDDAAKENDVVIRGYEHQSCLDFSLVEKSSPEWPEKKRIFAAKNVEKRGAYARDYLFDNYTEKDEVVIVSHGGYLHVLTEDWDSYDDMKGTGWENTERRSFVVKKNDAGKVVLEETEESIKNRSLVHTVDTDSGTERRETEIAGHHHLQTEVKA